MGWKTCPGADSWCDPMFCGGGPVRRVGAMGLEVGWRHAHPALTGLLYFGADHAVLPAVARRRPSPSALRAGWRPVAIAVVFGGALGPALLVGGLARIPGASASLLLNFELVATKS